MNHNYIVDNLSADKDIFKSLFNNISGELIKWKPSAEKWSLLEIVNHLYDEEREDFRQRLELVLKDPALPFPPIDPEGWVKDRKYSERDFNTSVNNFLNERDKSVVWLNSLKSPEWKNVHYHPKLGGMSAEMLLSNWLAHDYLHFRQITFLKYNYLNIISDEISLNYAGNW